MVLTPQTAERPPAEVGGTDRRVHPDAAAGAGEAQVELVVLVAHQVLVETPDAVEHLPPIGAEGERVDEARLGRCPERDPSDAEAAALRGGDGGGRRRLPDGLHGATDAFRAGRLQAIEAAAQVVGGDHAMTVDTDHDVTGHTVQPEVHGDRDDPSGVVDQLHGNRSLRGDPGDPVGCPVVGVAVDDDDLGDRHIGLLQHGAQAAVDEVGLVADGHDHRDRRITRQRRQPEPRGPGGPQHRQCV